MPPTLTSGADERSDGFQHRYRGFAFVVLAALVLFTAVWMILPFYPALIWAAVMAVLMTPIHRRIQKGKHPNWAATLTTLLTLAIIGLPVMGVGAALALQIGSFVGELNRSAPAGLRTDSSMARFGQA